MIVNNEPSRPHRAAIRADAATIIRNGITQYKERPASQLATAVRAAKSFLTDNSDIVLARADKGNVSVLMDRHDYDAKINSLLADESVYKVRKSNPTSGLQDRCNKLVDALIQGNHIPKAHERKYKTHNAVAPKIYGLPKCHKDGVPLRPVVSCLGSPGLALSRFVKELLAPLGTLGDFDVTNSYSFQREIVTFKLDPDEVMVSFDVVSLFTNVPLEIVVYLVM
ncbi:unnamed protein product, partial [Nesidiocoris tenuis]